MPPLCFLTILLFFVPSSLAQEKATQIEARCGASFTDQHKPVQLNVPPNSDCTWNIDRPSNETTRLVFSILDLNPSSDCSQENVTIYNEAYEVLGVLCPKSPRISVFESSGSLSVRVNTDDSSNAERIIYMFYYSFTPDNEPAQCGGNLRGFAGNIQSPNYPGRHPDFSFCVWHLDVPKNTKIDLSFSEIFLEIDPLCRFDFIALYDGPSTNSPLLDILCGRTTAQVETSSNSLTIMLSTDYANSYFGFSLDYVALPKSNTSALECSGEEMTVIISPSYLSSLGYKPNELTLSNNVCGPVSSTPVVFSVPYVGCGTIKKVDDHVVSYTNTITASAEGVITRRRQLQIVVTCELDSNSTVEIMYVTENEIIQDQQDTGKYDVSLAFYESQDFSSPVLDSPYFIDLNKTLFLQATLHTQDPQLTVFTDTCFASPNVNFQAPTYDLIRHGCVKDDTYHNFASGSGFARFSFSAFKFLHSHTSVYLQCRVVICDANDSTSRCTQGCVTRHRRDLGSQKWKANAVVGPVRLKHGSDTEAFDSISENRDETPKVAQNNYFLLGILVLVANVLILSLVVLRYSRKQPTGYRYHQLATE
ncbi:CUB and zona pellucida-like domain-containing protein 1 [Discoglossus pictus]